MEEEDGFQSAPSMAGMSHTSAMMAVTAGASGSRQYGARPSALPVSVGAPLRHASFLGKVCGARSPLSASKFLPSPHSLSIASASSNQPGPGGKGKSIFDSDAVAQALKANLKALEWDGACSLDNEEGYLTLYRRFLRAGRMSECLDVLECLAGSGKDVSNQVNQKTFLKSCERHRRLDEAVRFVALLKSPEIKTYNLLISVAARLRDLDSAFDVLDDLREAGLKPDVMLYTNLISACAKCHDADRAQNAYAMMVAEGIKPNIMTYSSVIHACSQEIHFLQGSSPDASRIDAAARRRRTLMLMERAMIVKDEMKKAGIPLDAVVYNSLLSVCGRAGQYKRSLEVWEEFQEEGIRPSAVTYGALIDACNRVGQRARAQELYVEFKGVKERGTCKLYTAAVRGCAMAADLDGALQIRKDMEAERVEPDQLFYATLMSVCGEAGDIEAAFAIKKEMMAARGPRPSVYVFNVLIGLCGKAGDPERAEGLVQEMRRMRVRPNDETFNALIDAYGKRGQLPRAMSTLQDMRALGLRPSTITYSSLINSFARAGDAEGALANYRLAREEGVPPSEVLCNTIIGVCLAKVRKFHGIQAGVAEVEKFTTEAMTVYRETLSAGVTPSANTLGALLAVLRLPTHIDRGIPLNSGSAGESRPLVHPRDVGDGCGIFDSRAVALYEEAIGKNIVPNIPVDRAVRLDLRNLPPAAAQVALLCMLRRMRVRLMSFSGDIELPNVVILVPTSAPAAVLEKKAQRSADLRKAPAAPAGEKEEGKVNKARRAEDAPSGAAEGAAPASKGPKGASTPASGVRRIDGEGVVIFSFGGEAEAEAEAEVVVVEEEEVEEVEEEEEEERGAERAGEGSVRARGSTGSRVGVLAIAVLRRLRIHYVGSHSQGEIEVAGTSLGHWLEPTHKDTTRRKAAAINPSSSAFSGQGHAQVLGQSIQEQQRQIRSGPGSKFGPPAGFSFNEYLDGPRDDEGDEGGEGRRKAGRSRKGRRE